MPRLPRLHIKGALFFVTCRGEDEQKIFQNEGDYTMFLELLKKYKEQYGIKVFAYALLPNHLHMLVEMTKEVKEDEVSKSEELSDFMHNLNNSYTKYFNGRYERKGHLLRERFKAAIVEKESYLLQMSAYIHLNPKKLNLVVEAKDYPYSSYQLYLCHKNCPSEKGLNLKNEIDEVFNLLGNRDYAEFVSGMTDEVGTFLHKNLQRGGIIGSDEFIKQVKSQIKAYKVKPENVTVEKQAKKYKLVITVGGILLVFMMGAAGAYFYVMNKVPKNATVGSPDGSVAQSQEDWKTQEWDVKLVPLSGGAEMSDTLVFIDGKFISARLYSLGYQSSNYSMSIQNNGKIIWETMQSAANGTASWRGEIEQEKMTGVLSLRKDGQAPQDFSFISIAHRRRK